MDENKEDKFLLNRKTKKELVLGVLHSIEERSGVITPQEIVNEARSEEHPLHDYFSWDNAEAAEKYRLMEARVLINSVRVEFMNENREAFLNVRTEVKNVPMRGYVSIERVMSDKELHKQVLAEAIAEVEYWQKKYNSLSEVKGLLNTEALEEAKKKI